MAGDKDSKTGKRSSASGARAAAPAAVEEQTGPIDLSQLTTEELQAELARRQAQAEQVSAGGPAVAERTQETIMSLYQELIDARDPGVLGVTGARPLVPIYQLREMVARRLGTNSSRPDHFDEQLMNLRRQGKIRIFQTNNFDVEQAEAIQAGRNRRNMFSNSIPEATGRNPWFYIERQ